MSALEQEIYEKFQQLDDEAKRRVLEHLNAEPEPFDYAAWFRQMDALREEMRVENGGVFPEIDVVGMLREIRDGEEE